MKFETLMLRGMFLACMALCALILGAMLNAAPSATQLASSGSMRSILLSAPASCALPPDGVVCPQAGG